MEYTQWVDELNALNNKVDVLILVVMEYTQWAAGNSFKVVKVESS